MNSQKAVGNIRFLQHEILKILKGLFVISTDKGCSILPFSGKHAFSKIGSKPESVDPVSLQSVRRTERIFRTADCTNPC